MAKLGRPRSENPLDQPVTARFDAATIDALDDFRGKWSRALAVRVLVERALFGDGDLGIGVDVPEADGLASVRVDLGVRMDPPRVDGLPVFRVVPGGAAERDGILVGDIIRSIDGKPIRDLDALVSSLEGKFAGEEVTVELKRRVNRRVKAVRLSVVLGRRPFD